MPHDMRNADLYRKPADGQPYVMPVIDRFTVLETQLGAVDRRLDRMQHMMRRLLDRWDEIETFLAQPRD